MLEILAIVFLCKSVGRIVRAKDRRAVGWQVLAVFLWLFGEVAGMVIGVMATFDPASTSEDIDPVVYLFALGGALAGGAMALIIAKLLPEA